MGFFAKISIFRANKVVIVAKSMAFGDKYSFILGKFCGIWSKNRVFGAYSVVFGAHTVVGWQIQ